MVANNQQSYIDLLLQRFNLMNEWLRKRNSGKTIPTYLRPQGITSVGVFGLGSFGERLLEELLQEKMTVGYIVERQRHLQGGRYEGIPVISTDLIRKYPGVPLLIVTPYQDLAQVKTQVQRLAAEIPLTVKGIDQIIQEL